MKHNHKRVELQLAPPERVEDRILSKEDLLGMLAKLPTIAEQRAIIKARQES